MAAVDRPLRFFGVLDVDWIATNLSAAESSFTEADPKPGTMSTDEPLARLVPQVLQVQSQPATIAVISSGNPFIGDGCVQVGYFLDGETITNVRGFEPPIRITDWTMAGAVLSEWADAAYFPLSGRVACVWESAIGIWNPHTFSWEYTDDDIDGGFGPPTMGTLAVVPGTERLLFVRADDVLLTDNYGTSWVVVRELRGPMRASTKVTPPVWVKMRSGFDTSGGLLVVGYDDNDASVDFIASSDLGCTWTEVDTLDAGDHDDFDLTVGTDGAFYLVTIDTIDKFVRVRRLGGAFDHPQLADVADVYTGGTAVGVSIACDHSGTLWVFVNDETDPELVIAKYSTDSGQTWSIGVAVFARGDADNFPRGWRYVRSPTGALCAATATSAALVADNHSGLMTLGGMAGPVFDLPRGNPFDGIYLDELRLTYGGSVPFNTVDPFHWHAAARPEDVSGTGLSKSGTGVTRHSSTIVGAAAPLGFVRVGDGADANAVNYLAQTTAALTTAVWGVAELAVRVLDDGGSDQAIFHSMIVDSTTNRRAWKVYFQEDGYRIWDDEANAWLGSKVLVDLTVRTHFRIKFADGDIDTTVVLRRADGVTKWETDGWNAITTSGAGGSVGGLHRFGKEAIADAEADFWYVNALTAASVDEEDYIAARTGVESYGAIADDLGRVVLPDLANVTAERVSYLRLRGGPGIAGEEYEHDVAPGYPVEALFPTREPSPSRRWRSLAKGVAQDFTIDMGFDTLPGGSASKALVVRGCNVRKLEVYTKEDGGGAYSLNGTLDLAAGFTALSFTRIGRRVFPAGVTVGARYIGKNELMGCHVILDTAGTPMPQKVLSNTAGFFNAAAGVKCSIILEDPDPGAVTTGLLDIVWDSGVLVMHGSGTQGNRYLRVRIPSTEIAVESYYEAGTIAMMGLVAPGKQWSANWSWDLTPNVRSDVDSYGTERRQQTGPSRRSIEISWDHGAKLDRIRGLTDADHLATSAAPFVVQDDVWAQMWGMLDQAQGGALPCLFMPVDPGAVTLTDRTLWMFGYVNGDLRIENASGDEGVDEFHRAALSFVEVV